VDGKPIGAFGEGESASEARLLATPPKRTTAQGRQTARRRTARRERAGAAGRHRPTASGRHTGGSLARVKTAPSSGGKHPCCPFETARPAGVYHAKHPNSPGAVNICPQSPNSAFVQIAFVEIAMLVCEQALGKFIPFRYRGRDRSFYRPVMRRHTQPQPLRDDAGVEETMLRHRAIEMPYRGLQKGATLRRFLIEPANVRNDRLRLVGQDRNDCKANGSDRVG
jgi:hypothetical protein